MTELKTFKLEGKFDGPWGLFLNLLENIELLETLIGVKIQKPLRLKPFCIVGKERITERNIIFFASKSEPVESIGELIMLASVFDADIIVCFLIEKNIVFLDTFNWLQKICNEDTQFIVGEADF